MKTRLLHWAGNLLRQGLTPDLRLGGWLLGGSAPGLSLPQVLALVRADPCQAVTALWGGNLARHRRLGPGEFGGGLVAYPVLARIFRRMRPPCDP